MTAPLRIGAALWLCGLVSGCASSATESLAITIVLDAESAMVADLVATAELTGNLREATSLRWSWEVDGVLTDIVDPVVPADRLALGQAWTAQVEADGDDGVVRASSSTLVSRYGGNILVVVVDDLGMDKVGAYGIHDAAPPTPNIDALAAEGVMFRNAWVQPTCSPSRAALLTGRYPRRTGIGHWIEPRGQSVALDVDEVILPEMLEQSSDRYADAAVGKYHLTGFYGRDDAHRHPLDLGFSWYAGSLGNPSNSIQPADDVEKGYHHWEKSENGALAFSQTYMTTDTTNDALARIGVMPEPWLLWVAYNAPHVPLHVPPAELHSYDLDPQTATDADLFDAMAEALDTEVGRLFDGIPPALRARTTIVFLSDNGTPQHAIRPPLDPDRCKGSMYSGGVNVPWIVAGPTVTHPGTESLALVESVDLFHTVAELAGVDLEQVMDPRTGLPVRTDGVSFLAHVEDPELPSTRDRAYSSRHEGNGPPPWVVEIDTLRNERFKVSVQLPNTWKFFEYVAPFDEGEDLLVAGPMTPEQQQAFEDLGQELLDRTSGIHFGP